MDYVPRTSQAAFDVDGNPIFPWDPYPQYSLELYLFDDDGKIKPELLPPASSTPGVSDDVQAAIDLAHDDAVAQASNALTVAQGAAGDAADALTAVADGVANAQTTADNAVAVAGNAQTTANQALETATTGVADAVETYLSGAGSIFDENGRLESGRSAAPLGGLYTTNTAPGTDGGTFIYAFTATPTGDIVMPAPGLCLDFAQWTIKNSSNFSCVVDFFTNGGVLDSALTTVTLAAGDALVFTCDGVSKFYIISKHSTDPPPAGP